MISVTVKLFAAVRDIVGREETVVLLPNNSRPSTLLDVLAVEHPAMKEWKPHLRVAVNWEYVRPDYVLHDRDEVALLPPVSGG
jgi:molybdopterin converting factor subunit 1